MNLLPAGDRALLIEVGDNARVHRLAQAVRERLGDQIEDVVPGHQTLMVIWRPGAVDLTRAREALTELAATEVLEIRAPAGDPIVIPVSYDGPDLEAVAELCGLTVDELVELHCGSLYSVAFVGFAPGFGYLIGGDERLRVPRLKTPRVKVPAGSVAIAGDYSAVYPTDGPGGWQLIGRTDSELFGSRAERILRFRPGASVRFERVAQP